MRREALVIPVKVGGLPVVKSIEEAVERLKRDPTRPVRAKVGGLTIEVTAVADEATPRSAASVFAEIGPWEGETAEELLALLADARHRGGQRPVPEL